MSDKITAQRAYDLLKEVVALKKDGKNYVYKSPAGEVSCVYMARSTPSCIVGRALYNAGISAARLRAWDRGDGTDVFANPTIEQVFNSGLLPEATLAGIAVLRAAQEVQDSCSETWGTALKYARKQLKEKH